MTQLTFFYQSTSDPNFHDSPEICPDYQEDVQNIAVKGRLRRNISFWEYIGASWFIRQTILEGYKIPFYFTPAPATFGNNKSSMQHADFVHKAITDLLAVGSVVECSSPPSVINPLSVSIQSNGKKRLILDLRYPNSFVKKFTIKFEDAKTMLNSFIDHSQICLRVFGPRCSALDGWVIFGILRRNRSRSPVTKLTGSLHQ